jgi:hypothetical protein
MTLHISSVYFRSALFNWKYKPLVKISRFQNPLTNIHCKHDKVRRIYNDFLYDQNLCGLYAQSEDFSYRSNTDLCVCVCVYMRVCID